MLGQRWVIVGKFDAHQVLGDQQLKLLPGFLIVRPMCIGKSRDQVIVVDEQGELHGLRESLLDGEKHDLALADLDEHTAIRMQSHLPRY